MTAGTLADLLRGEGLAAHAPEASDAIGAPRTQSVPTPSAGRDMVGTLKPKRDAVSRLSRLSRPEKQEVEGERSAQANMTGAGGAGAAEDPFARAGAVERLRKAADALGVDAGQVLALDDADPCELLALPDVVVVAYVRAMIETAERKAGRVPAGWNVAAECAGCGPVWLGAGSPARVQACPWCWNRRAGLDVGAVSAGPP